MDRRLMPRARVVSVGGRPWLRYAFDTGQSLPSLVHRGMAEVPTLYCHGWLHGSWRSTSLGSSSLRSLGVPESYHLSYQDCKANTRWGYQTASYWSISIGIVNFLILLLISVDEGVSNGIAIQIVDVKLVDTFWHTLLRLLCGFLIIQREKR